MKNIDEIRNYFIEETKENEFMSKKHKKVCRVLNTIEHLLILVSTDTGSVSISTSASLVGISIGSISSTIGLKNLCNNCRSWKVSVNN